MTIRDDMKAALDRMKDPTHRPLEFTLPHWLVEKARQSWGDHWEATLRRKFALPDDAKIFVSKPSQQFAGMVVDCDPSIEPEEAFGYDAFGNQVDPTIETEILRMMGAFRAASRIDPTRLVIVRIHGRVIHSVTT